MLFLLLPLWALIASPVIAGFVLVGRFMPDRTLRPTWTLVAAALAFALLASPVPTPIITILEPLGLVLVSHERTSIGAGIDPFQAKWIVASFLVTATGAFVIMRNGRNWWSKSSKRVKACGVGLLAVWAVGSLAFLVSRALA